MEFERERPPAYAHVPSDLKLPSVPNHDIPSNGSPSLINLPDLRSLGLPEARHSNEHWPHYRQNGQLNPNAFPSVPSAPPRASVDPPLGSPMATESILSSDDRAARAPSVMSMDDPDTRMAVEALSGLKNPEFMRSPSARSTTLSNHQSVPYSPPQEETEEPILSLVTANHPWIGATINGSVATYNFSKHYSPAFIRNGAEFVERNVGSPIASTLRRTGVEGGVRRYLGDRRPSDFAKEERQRKRARERSPDKDVEKGVTSPSSTAEQRRSRAGSQASFASLPPYDEHRSPRYEELATTTQQEPSAQKSMSAPRNWRTQLMITTSGLGAALSEVSLKNLRFCLGLLRGATDSITTMMVALKKLLDDYEERARNSADETLPNFTLTQEQEAASTRIAESIKSAHREIMKTLESITNSISHYAGAALPENAAALVRRQLMSLPQRWRVAESTAAEQNGANGHSQTQSEMVKAGKTIVVFAGQSLDMLAQVTMVVSATIQNAEGWLERMGRRSGQSQVSSPPAMLPAKDDRKTFDSQPQHPVGVDYQMMEKK
ncbi:uncharacterized protein PV09_02282 [Verruconis gallopava]|uniref:Opi1-domain-containing protein n=1 Tax=Verruconis gallopava TaxID=253628 RepID=A0A0D1Z3C4_9PEZI|nr:uncharacterized protein PV09_02282 [Verruconis gallopava]KIW07442.1 hypothetical protein PV09_02282 [Verruconis gallopava]